jgi:iron complex transport system ATP-binding protein
LTHTLLHTEDLTTGYTLSRKDIRVVSGHLNLSLCSGELVCLIGPNGAGKSTLMQTLAGMVKPLKGDVFLGDQNVDRMTSAALAKALSIVLTERPDVGLLTGRGLVALGRHPYTDWSGTLSAHDHAMVDWALHAVSAEAFADKPVAQLSDGQRQKVMIGRALAQEGGVILLDEPTAFLDLPRRVEMMRLLKTLARVTERAVLLSTHDLDLALRTADRIWLISQEGAVTVGAPEDLVLSGAFARVFAAEGVTFDSQSGSFDIAGENHGTVQVTGEGLALIWTRRALQREGYTPTSDIVDIRVEIDALEEGWTWRLWRQGEKVSEYSTLEALMKAL